MKDEGASLDKVVKYWPLLVVLGAMISGYLKLTYQVEQYKEMSDRFKNT